MKKLVVGIFGLANAGKSTLTNKLTKYNDLVVSSMENTTINSVKSPSFKFNDYEITLIDTPGFVPTDSHYRQILDSQIAKAIRSIDLAIVVFRSDARYVNNLFFQKTSIFKRFPEVHKVLLLNLIDNKELRQETLQLIQKEFKHDIFVQANIVSSIPEDLMSEIFKGNIKINLNKKELINKTSDNDDYQIIEAIREQIILLTRHEIPHCVHVRIRQKEFNPQANVFKIDAELIVESDNQKKIIIGRHASLIKQIGTGARVKLLKIYKSRIYLALTVKVIDN